MKTSKPNLSVVLIIVLIIIIGLYILINKPNYKNNIPEFSIAQVYSRELVEHVHKKIAVKEINSNLIQQYSCEDISKYHFFFCVERCNTAGDIGQRRDTDYSKAASLFSIPSTTLKALDQYYHYNLMPELSKVIRTIYNNNINLQLDAYTPVNQTAYCGIHTLMGWMRIYGNQNTDCEAEAKRIVSKIQNNLPEWITGFKFTHTVLIDTLEGTESEVNLGFLWRKGDDIKMMDAIIGTYGYRYPYANRNWSTDEWNNLKNVAHPDYGHPIY